MAQAALTGVDTWMTREWREKQRTWRLERTTWRADDIEFRSQETLLWKEEESLFQAKLRWRGEDMQQRSIDNSRYMWNRCNNDWEKSFHLFVWGICFFLELLRTMGFIKFSFANGVAILFTTIIGVVFFIWY